MAGKGRAVILHHRFIAGVAAIFNTVVNGGDLDRLAVRALKLVIPHVTTFAVGPSFHRVLVMVVLVFKPNVARILALFLR